MPIYHTRTQHYYNFWEIAQEIENKSGRRIRDWDGYFKNDGRVDKTYQDFWHILNDVYHVSNDKVMPINFDIVAKTSGEPWVRDVCDWFTTVLGDEHRSEDGEYNILMVW